MFIKHTLKISKDCSVIQWDTDVKVILRSWGNFHTLIRCFTIATNTVIPTNLNEQKRVTKENFERHFTYHLVDPRSQEVDEQQNVRSSFFLTGVRLLKTSTCGYFSSNLNVSFSRWYQSDAIL